MRLFLWQVLEHVSDNWHPEGGVAIIARDEAAAADLIARTEYVEVTAKEWAEVVTFDGVQADEERIFIFPDAGCC